MGDFVIRGTRPDRTTFDVLTFELFYGRKIRSESSGPRLPNGNLIKEPHQVGVLGRGPHRNILIESDPISSSGSKHAARPLAREQGYA